MFHTNSIESLSTTTDSTLVGGYPDDRHLLNLSSSNASLAKTFRSIRKHFTWTSNKNLSPMASDDDHRDLHPFDHDQQTTLSKPISTTFSIPTSSSPSDRSSSTWDNPVDMYSASAAKNQSHHGSYSYEYTSERFPKGIASFPTDLQHQTMKTQHSISSSYTSYQTRSFTVQNHLGARSLV